MLTASCLGEVFPEIRRTEKEPFPRPVENAVSQINPPAFVWLPLKKASSYKINIQEAKSDNPIISKETRSNCLVLSSKLKPGDHTWTVEAFDSKGNSMAKRKPYNLHIPSDATDFSFPDIKALKAKIKPHHPRLIFDKDEIEAIRKTLKTTRRAGWLAVKEMADESLKLDNPVLPWYEPIEDYKTRRLEYRKYFRYFRAYVDEGLQSLAMAWLMTGEQKYADKAKELLFVVIEWDPHGITSSNKIGFDEPGLSLARCIHRVYDWLYDSFDDDEREKVRDYIIERTRDTWNRVGIKRPYLQNPGASHDARLIGYLGEQALVLAGEADDTEVEKWMDFSLTAFWTVFPHWAGSDGGWAEGIGYAAAYNTRATNWIESFLSTTGLNMWDKPFFQKIRNYLMYCARPNDEFWAFGDGAERGPRLNPSRAMILRTLMSHYAQRFEDTACEWWANQIPLDKNAISNPPQALILGIETKGQPPINYPQAAVFRDVGWSAMHSDLSDLKNDVFFLFKSSPYGSISHSHADQNSFYLSVGGLALAIPSGYYGPVYGMPHHAEWTRSSKANNTILVNETGQVVRDFTATGSIKDFIHDEKLSYVCGDAAPAYKGSLTKFDRHILYVRPGFFVILDDLAVPKASSFQWMLHSLDKMKVDVEHQRIEINRKRAKAQFKLFTSNDKSLAFSQTDQFDTPFNAGTKSDYHVEVDNHWHLTASTKTPVKKMRIAAFVNAGIKLYPMMIQDKNGWQQAVVQLPEGQAELWAQIKFNAPVPDELLSKHPDISEETIVFGKWISKEGKVQTLSRRVL